MPTIRGFVERLEVGRAGLAVASLLHDDGTSADYQLADLDADPERFNERLSKLGLLRDAMSRAEPVEIEYSDGEAGTRSIDRISRITRDVLAANGATSRVSVFVAGISLLVDNRTGARAEASDVATVVTMTESGTTGSYVLDLQLPERAVAGAMLQVLRDAQADGSAVTLVVDTKRQRIVGVEAGGAGMSVQAGDGGAVDGFVESITVAPGMTAMGNLALVAFTTAPPFGPAGNVVSLVPFTPTLVSLLVVQGSAEYELFVDGLRDKLRMRVMLGAVVGGKTDTPIAGNVPANPDAPKAVNPPVNRLAATGAANGTVTAAQDTMTLVRGVQLVAALASASRPVWIRIARQSLDVGPEIACTDGLPSSDLSPQTLRDLRLPYTAEWLGWGCFNHGVYRLQFELGVEFEVFIDGKLLCLHASDDGKVKFAHACLHDEHEVRVVLTRWTCAQVFQMDVYRIR
ncbi:MAG: hypothetical protein ABI460_03740 [Caldimonas sp.]